MINNTSCCNILSIVGLIILLIVGLIIFQVVVVIILSIVVLIIFIIHLRVCCKLVEVTAVNNKLYTWCKYIINVTVHVVTKIH